LVRISDFGAVGRCCLLWLACSLSLPSFYKPYIPCSSQGDLRHIGHISLDCVLILCSLWSRVDYHILRTGRAFYSMFLSAHKLASLTLDNVSTFVRCFKKRVRKVINELD